MNIDPADNYRGIPMLDFRQRLRESVHAKPSPDTFEYHFDAELIESLLEDGYIEPVPPSDSSYSVEPYGCGQFSATPKAFQVINATAAKPTRRTTAQKALDGLLARMTEAENDPYTWWVVNRAVLFGSMMDETREYVSDVDVAIKLITHPDPQRTPPRDVIGILTTAWLSKKPVPKGFRWRDDSQLWKFLRNRQRSLSLMTLTDEDVAGLGPDVPHRLIYDRERGGRLDADGGRSSDLPD